MPKRVVSFTLSDESIKKINKTSKALGVSRSELLESLISKGLRFSKDVESTLEQISKLQKKASSKIRKEF